MAENNVMSIDELLNFVENKNAWDYYKFSAFYNDKYRLKYHLKGVYDFLISSVCKSDYCYNNLLKYLNYEAQYILSSTGLLKNISQAIKWHKKFKCVNKPTGEDFVNLCNFFLYLHDKNKEKFNLIAKLVTNAQCAVLLACVSSHRKDRIAQFLANEFLNSDNDKIFNIIAMFLSEAYTIKSTYYYDKSIAYHIILTIKKFNMFYNLIFVKDDKFKRIDEDFDYHDFFKLDKIQCFPDNYKISKFKKKLKNNGKYRQKIAKTMALYFNKVIGNNNNDVSPFEAFCYIGFRLRPYEGLNKLQFMQLFMLNREDISCFCYILFEYFNKMFTSLIPDRVRDVRNKRYSSALKIFNKIFEKGDYYEIFKFIAESSLENENNLNVYINQFKSLKGMDEIFTSEDE